MEFLSPLFQNLFREYATAHSEPRNRLIHFLGVPLIVLSVLGLLGHIHSSLGIRWDFVAVLMAGVFYIRNAGWIAFPFVVALLLLCVVSRFIGVHALWTFFILSWAAQFFGHFAFEKNSPSIVDNLVHLLISPFWIYCRLARRLPFYSDLFTENEA